MTPAVQSWAGYQLALLRRLAGTSDTITRRELMELFRRAGHVAVRLRRQAPRATMPS